MQPGGLPVFVLSLPGSTRLRKLAAKLDELEIPFEIISAVDGIGLSDSDCAAVYDETQAMRSMGRPLSRGEIGAALSHIALFRMLVKRNTDCAIVLEDDAIVGDAFKSVWLQAASIPDSYGLVLLYGEGGFVDRSAATHVGPASVHRVTAWITSCVGYRLTKSCAETLLMRSEKIVTAADQIFHRAGIDQYLVLPMPLAHDPATSIIGPGRQELVTKWALPISRGPRWLRSLLFLLYVGYVLAPSRYEGLANYTAREVKGRLKYLFSPGQLSVRAALLRARV